MLLKKIKHKIDKSKVVSFDIFDTLLVRPYINPNDLFDHLGILENVLNFRELREKAFNDAISKYRNGDIEEVTLSQIYEFIPHEYQYLKDKELELENYILRVNEEIFEVYNYALSKNKQIIIISDMFLPQEFIENILAKRGYKNYYKLFLSSTCKKLKSTGNLFDLVLKDLKIKSSDILHIGDNEYSDYKIPKKFGIKAIKYEKLSLQFFSKNKKAAKFYNQNSKNLTVSIIFGCLALELNKKHNYWYKLGFNYGGAFILSYMYWLKNVLQIDKIKEVLFVARDGYTLEKVLNLLDNEIKTHYVYAPRLISLCCKLDIKDKINASDFECIDAIKSIINYYKPKTSNMFKIPKLVEKNDYVNFWEKHEKDYCKLAKIELEQYKNYLTSLNIKENKIAFVDVMTTFFTGHRFIQDVIDKDIVGYYYFVSKTYDVNRNGLKYKNYTDKFFNIKFIELLVSSPEAPIIKMEDNKPLYKKINKFDKYRMDIYPDISQGELDFAKLLIDCFGNTLIQLDIEKICDWLNDFPKNFTFEDILKLRKLSHSWNVNHSKYSLLFEELGWKCCLQNIFSVKNSSDKSHKIVKILGIEIKFKKNENFIKSFSQSLFSVKNNNNYKIWTILGVKLKFKMNRAILYDIKDDVSFIADKIQNLTGKKSLLWQGIMDTCPDSFKDYILTHDIQKNISLLKRNLDEKSLKLLDITLKKIINLPDYSYSKYLYIDENQFKAVFQTEQDKKFEMLKEECSFNVKNRYKLSVDTYDMEVFVYHHGLRFANQKIKEYVKNKDFIDAGAYVGDSALVFMNYNPNKVYSFEISNTHYDNYIKTMRLNGICDNKYLLSKLALSDKEDDVQVVDDGGMGIKIFNNDGYKLKSTSLDSFLSNKNCNIGFIKADIEGAMYKALIGMKETIYKYRPVLSFSIYHSPEEFFKTKPLLDEITKNLNYKIEFDCHYPECFHIYGTIIWAYPKELEN